MMAFNLRLPQLARVKKAPIAFKVEEENEEEKKEDYRDNIPQRAVPISRL